MRAPHRFHLVALAVVATALSEAPRSLADTESSTQVAERLFREGRDAVKKGDYAAACPKFEDSQRLDPANGTLLNLALCEESWGRLAEARTHLRELLDAPDLDEKRRAIAVEHARSLERTPHEEERQAAPVARETPQAPPAPREVVHAGPERAASEPAPPHAAVYVLGGLGLLSLTTCAVTGILVIERADTVETHCPNKLCDAEGLAAASSGRTLSAVSTATFGAGIALTALSAYFLLQSSDRSRRSAIGVRGTAGGAVTTWVQDF